MISRIWAFLRGDMMGAENLQHIQAPDKVSWLEAAAQSGEKAIVAYGLEAARRSAENAEKAVEGLEDKAGNLLTLLIGLVPFLIAATALSGPGSTGNLARWFALLLFLGAAGVLIGAIVMAALATGLRLGGGLNIQRLMKDGAKASMIELTAAEADAWHAAAMLAMETATRKARDLFRARQLMIWALAIAIAASALLLMSVGGNAADLMASPTPSLTLTPSVGPPSTLPSQ